MPIRVQAAQKERNAPCRFGAILLRKRPSFDQFGPPRPETRVLSVKTGDSGLDKKCSESRPKASLETYGGRTPARPLEGLQNPVGKPGVRDHGVPQDPVFGLFATVGFDS